MGEPDPPARLRSLIRIPWRFAAATFSIPLEFIFSLLIYLVLIAIITYPVLFHMKTIVIGAGEFGGWLWRYWWMKQEIAAIMEVAALNPLSRFFTIVSLGMYPETGNIMHLLTLSYPLEKVFPFPLYYNIQCLLIILLNCFSFQYLIKGFTGSRILGLCAGVMMAVNPYVLQEIQYCGLRQAILFFIPPFLYFFHRMGGGGRWYDLLFSGVFLALTSIFYWFYGLFLVLYAAIWTLLASMAGFIKPKGVIRVLKGQIIPFLFMLLVMTLLAAPFAYSYFKGYTIGDDVTLPEVSWFTPFPPLKAILNVPSVPQTPVENYLSSLNRVLRSSMSLDYMFNPFHQKSGLIPLTLFALIGGLLTLKRSYRFLLLFLLFYLLSGGPFLKLFDTIGQDNFIFIKGEYAVRLPFCLFYQWVPLFSRLFAPYRVIPFATIPLLLIFADITGNLLFKKRKISPFLKGIFPSLITLMCVAQVLFRFFLQTFFVHVDSSFIWGVPLLSSRIAVNPFYQRLGQEEVEGIIELPLQAQQDLINFYQTIHGKKVMMGWANLGALPPVLRGDAGQREGKVLFYLSSPERITGNTFIDFLKGISGSTIEAGRFLQADLEEIRGQGFSLAILHERGYYLLNPNRGGVVYDRVKEILSTHLSPPLFEDIEFKVEDYPGRRGGKSAGVDLPWLSSEIPLIPQKRPAAYRMAVFPLEIAEKGDEMPQVIMPEEVPAVVEEGPPPPPQERSPFPE